MWALFCLFLANLVIPACDLKNVVRVFVYTEQTRMTLALVDLGNVYGRIW
jgi:hypothetical protein